MLIFSCLIDWILGDPESLPHPVRLMGFIINKEEKLIRKIFKSPNGLKFAGFLMALINILGTFFLIRYFLKLLDFNKYLKLVVTIHLGYTTIAAKSLADEAREVKKNMKISLERGRNRLKYIVGRNTERLSQEGIIRAVVETVAENTSDGVIAPMFYLVFGLEFAFAYKMINTMDSMVAYKNEKYKDLGFFPAKIDDLANLIPARLTSFLMMISSIPKYGIKNSFFITLRDHNKSSSPNSAWPESTVAGILGIKLGGGLYYDNIYVQKPYIGDAKRPIRAKDIDDTIKIMYKSQILFLIIYAIYLIFYKGIM